ncbi:MAG: ribonuclease III [Coriobacteriia bacterium]|nr:ribonuclease III [Coriobacteriia bacterium]
MGQIYEDMQEQIAQAEERIGYTFNDKSLLVQALTHPSAAEDDPIHNSYERLEFLGDSLLGAFVAFEVFQYFPDFDEGGLTRMKVNLVSGGMLSKCAEELGFADIIIFGSSERGTGKRGLASALENVFEALTAAIALDGSIEAAREWVIKALGDQITNGVSMEIDNPKSILQEILQVEHITPTYQLDDASGPPHARIFTCSVLSDGSVIGTGVGYTKKEAEAEAATQALQNMRNAGRKKKPD